jgi:hypothetical protein
MDVQLPCLITEGYPKITELFSLVISYISIQTGFQNLVDLG